MPINETSLSDIILNLGAEITAIRDQEALFDFIFITLRETLKIDDAVLHVWQLDEQKYLRRISTQLTAKFGTSGFTSSINAAIKGKAVALPQGRQLEIREPVLLNLDNPTKDYLEEETVKVTQELGYKEALIIPLQIQGERTGFVELFTSQTDYLRTIDSNIIILLERQLGACIFNILLNEEILERQQESDMLIEMRDIFLSDKSWEDQVIHFGKRIFDQIPFKHFILDLPNHIPPPDMLVLEYSNGNFSTTTLGELDKAAGVTMKEAQTYFNQVKQEYLSPQIFDTEKMEELCQRYAYKMRYKQAHNHRSQLIIPFINDKISIRIAIFSDAEDQYTLEHLNKNLQILPAIALAVEKKFLFDQLAVSEREKARLLNISEAMTAIRNRHDLFRVMTDQIGPVLNFSDAIITKVDTTYSSFQTFLTDLPDAPKRHPKYGDAVDVWMPIVDSEVEFALRQEDVFTWKTDEILGLYPDSPVLQLLKDTGLTHSIGTKLYQANELMGFLFFHFDHEPTLEESLIKNIGEQSAAALSNILANEEILERQQEKEVLLTISEQVAQARNWNELFVTVLEKLRPIFGFADAVITYPTKDSFEKLRILTAENELNSTHSKYYYDIMGHEFDVPPHFKEIYKSQEPKFYTIDDYEELSGSFRGVSLMKEMGLTATWASALLLGNKVIGSLEMHFKSQAAAKDINMGMFKNVLNQLSVAVSNILANEDILKRQREKESLLAISKGIALVKNRQDLYQLMAEKVKPHIPFDAVVLTTIDHQKKLFRVFLDQTDALNTESPIYRRLMSTLVSSEDPATKAIFNAEDFTLISIDEQIERFPDFVGHQLMKSNGFNYAYKFNLKSSGRIYGVGAFHFREEHLIDHDTIPFLSNVISQISVAVFNIISNEEIVYREKVKSLRASIAQAITSGENWSKRFTSIMMALKDVFPFDYISIAIDAEDAYAQGCAFEKIGFDEYRLMKAEQFFERSGMSLEDYTEARQKVEYDIPEIWTGDNFRQVLEKDKIKGVVAKLFKLQSNLNVPLNLSRKGQFQLSLYSREENAYNPQHLAFMQQLLPALIHPLEKIVAFDQIEKLNTLLKQEKEYLQEEIKVNSNFEEIIGSSESLQYVFEKIRQVADTSATVLITGETGTGKELVARAIHNVSGRRLKPLVKLNCATLPTELLESELFGHEKGAFTGAVKQRIGKFELAHAGSIFLDEIGEIPMNLQAKLLRVIQEKQFERLGGNRTINTDVRIIVATNRILEEAVAKGEFRSDLFFRLNVFPIHLPPLRDRKEDIPALTTHFLQKISKKIGKEITGIASSSLKELMEYDWPGNIRELEHLVERATLLNQGSKLNISLNRKGLRIKGEPLPKFEFQPQRMADAEREFILNTLRYCGGKVRGKGGAAELLDLHPSTLDSRMKKLGIEKRHIFKNKAKG
ncbi:MAG: sigma 54-interacting transcriptional regulator [Saprospiraceae bacterium]|nr:sigma 54-interacting transcriptional regulator [Saprospiraceae bacterium]